MDRVLKTADIVYFRHLVNDLSEDAITELCNNLLGTKLHSDLLIFNNIENEIIIFKAQLEEPDVHTKQIFCTCVVVKKEREELATYAISNAMIKEYKKEE